MSQTRILKCGAVAVAALLLASCAGEPSAMSMPKIDPVANAISSVGEDEEESDEGDSKDDPSEDPDASSSKYKAPASAEVTIDSFAKSEDGTEETFTIEGRYDSNEKAPKAEVAIVSEDGSGDMAWILVDGDLYCQKSKTWSKCGTSDFRGLELESEDSIGKQYADVINVVTIKGFEDTIGDAAAEEDGKESINGVNTKRYKYTQKETEFTFWVDSKNQIVRLDAEMKSSSASTEVSWNFTSIGKKVDVTAPK